MAAWWSSLSSLNQFFWGLVVFFSTLFVWQLVASFAGVLGGVGADTDGALDADADLDGDGDLVSDDADLTEDMEGLSTFRLLSVRSVLAFCTLFSWAAALYLGRDVSRVSAFAVAALWGLAGMLVVALFFWLLPRLTEEGTADLSSAQGQKGTVYVNIPADGDGQVRLIVGGRLRFLRARAAHGASLTAGTEVRVIRVTGGRILEVEEVE